VALRARRPTAGQCHASRALNVKGEVDKLMAAFTLANGAVSMALPVTMFLPSGQCSVGIVKLPAVSNVGLAVDQAPRRADASVSLS
jgi:hypothetical protein